MHINQLQGVHYILCVFFEKIQTIFLKIAEEKIEEKMAATTKAAATAAAAVAAKLASMAVAAPAAKVAVTAARRQQRREKGRVWRRPYSGVGDRLSHC